MNNSVVKGNEIKNKSQLQINKRLNMSKCNPGYISLQPKAIANPSIVEYVQLTQDKTVVVTEDDVWIRTATDGSVFTPQLSTKNIDKIETTRKLLDTAIILGKRGASIAQQNQNRRLSVDNWVWSLISQYHTAYPTSQLMWKAAQKFREQGRDLLAEWAAEKAQEETGHDRLALKDIESLGYQDQALVDAHQPNFSKILTDYFAQSVEVTDPIKVVGYAYALERNSLTVKENHIQAIENILPPGVNATRFLRVHSSVGSDAEHVDEALETIALLSTSERTQIAIACYETARLSFSTAERDFPTAIELQNKLKPFQQQNTLAQYQAF